jgi:hypothetical protein
MNKFLPTELHDIAIGDVVRVYETPENWFQGRVISRRLDHGTMYFTVARDAAGQYENLRWDERSLFNVRVLRDTDKAIAAFMAKLRRRWRAPDLLRDPQKLVGGPFDGQPYRARSHAGTTLPFTVNGMTGRYKDYTWEACQ